jgi:hypothetical protein
MQDCLSEQDKQGSSQRPANPTMSLNIYSRKTVKRIFYPILMDFRKVIPLWNLSKLLSFAFSSKKNVDENEYGALVK